MSTARTHGIEELEARILYSADAALLLGAAPVADVRSIHAGASQPMPAAPSASHWLVVDRRVQDWDLALADAQAQAQTQGSGQPGLLLVDDNEDGAARLKSLQGSLPDGTTLDVLPWTDESGQQHLGRSVWTGEITPAAPATDAVTGAATVTVSAAPEAPAATAVAAVAAADDWLPVVRKELVIIDGSVENAGSLALTLWQEADPSRQMAVVITDPTRDGLSQVTDLLAQRTDLSAVHIISHGAAGELMLGNTMVDAALLRARAGEVASWQSALTDDADLLLYGCDVASTLDGVALADTLGQLTGASVAASDDLTGAAAQGGDWNLEYHYGSIDAGDLFNASQLDGLQQWQGVLATYTVTNVNDAGAGSLRQAIYDANANPGLDNINFSISGANPYVISPITALPSLTSPVNIDGTTDNNFALNGNKPVIVLDGHNAIQDGLELYAGSDGSTVRGLVIERFTQDGIDIASSNGNTIVGNWLGVGADGVTGMGNQQGVNLWNADNNTIGGTTAADRNVMSDNSGPGIWIGGTATSNVVKGNYIGTDVSGQLALGNSDSGILLGSPGNIIGGIGNGEGNVISASRNFHGINLGPTASNTTVQGNIIGLNATGASPLGNTGAGVAVSSSYNLIGGYTTAARNLISANNVGVLLDGSSATANTVAGNYIGLDITGLVDRGNASGGVTLQNGASGNTIGGTTAASRNIISGNDDGVQIDGEASDNNTVLGNWIGVSADGTTAIGNGGDGIFISRGADGTQVGGPGALDGNWIASPGLTGIEIDGISSNSLVQGNRIGTNLAGVANWGPAQNGMLIENSFNPASGGPSSNIILDNVVAFSGQGGVYTTGVQLSNTAKAGNALLGNQIYSSQGLAIDLGGDGLTANDAGDADVGPNDRLNYPVLSSAVSNGADTTVTGTISSVAGTALRIEFFSTPLADASGHGEASVFLGATSVTTNAGGSASFAAILPGITVQPGHKVTATSTIDLGAGVYGSTSELATNVTATTIPPGISVSAVSNAVGENGSTATFTVVLDAKPGANVVVPLSSADPGEMTLSATSLTFTPLNWSLAQTVTVTGVDDTFIDGAQVVNVVTGPVVSADVGYNGLNPVDVAVQNNDNDTFNTLVVDTTADTADGDTSSIAALMANKGADGFISLREAIAATNNTANGTQADRINFNIASALVNGAHTITLATALPTVDDAVVIDATTDSDYVTGQPVIELTNGGSVPDGLKLNASNSTIRGMSFTGFSGSTALYVTGSGNTIVGNWVGIRPDGSTSGATVNMGVLVTGSGNLVGGTTLADRNVIGNASYAGVIINGGSADNNRVSGNYIGLKADGTTPAVFGNFSIAIFNNADGNIIGTNGDGVADALEGNVITTGWMQVGGGGMTGLTVAGNKFGTDASGLVKTSGGYLEISGGSGVRIGTNGDGTSDIAEGNVFADGIGITQVVNGFQIAGNTIGVASDGVTSLGSTIPGVLVSANATGTIGGVSAVLSNTIAHANGAGIGITGTGAVVSIGHNVLYGNTGLGIDVGAAGVTTNDLGDTDTGANNLQNFPVLATVSSIGGDTTITGSFNSNANKTYRIEFFSAPLGDASGHGEGQVYLGFASVTTNGSGNAAINTLLTGVTVMAGDVVTATATQDLGAGVYGATSEFAANVVATGTPAGFTVTALANTSEGTATGRFSVVLNTMPVANVTIPLSVTDPSELSAAVSSLVFTSANWNVAQTVTVSGVDDTLVDGDVWSNIILGNATSTDLAYNGLKPADLSMVNTDDDTVNRIVVDTAADTLDGDTSSLAALLASKGTDGRVSLREAITAANNTANGSGGADVIAFSIPDALAGGVHTITLSHDGPDAGNNPDPLPVITTPLVIDATTEPDFAGVPMVVLDGVDTPAATDGLSISGGGSTVRGLVIQNFSNYGINIYGLGGNVIAGNYIGTNAAGTASAGNGWGVSIHDSANNVIGGTTAADRNVLSGNFNDGVDLVGTGATGNVIEGNYIGTSASGLQAVPNLGVGVWIGSGASNNTVGGTITGTRNLLSGNTNYGVELQDNASTGNTIRGNWIGLDATGSAALSNGGFGVVLDYKPVNTLIADNVISGNVNPSWSSRSGGMYLYGDGVTVQGNLIGLDATGTFLIPNGGGTADNAGIHVMGGASSVLIGGTALGQGNVVAGNLGPGIVSEALYGDMTVLGNRIYANTGIGIDLNKDGVTLNDAGDADTGPNQLQNFPMLYAARSLGGDTNIIGEIRTTAGTSLRIEYFYNPSGTEDASGYGEGKFYLGYEDVTTDGTGYASINTTLSGVTLSAGDLASATATVKTGVSTYAATSEFAMNVPVTTTNARPISGASGSTQPEDSASIQILLSGSDTDGTVTAFQLGSLPAHGVLYTDAALTQVAAFGVDIAATAEIGTLYFVPDADWNGSTTFQYLAKDDLGAVSLVPGSGTVNVTAANDAPMFSHLDGAPSVVVNGTAALLDGDVTVADPELSTWDNFNGATLTLVRNGGASNQDVFSATGTLSALTEGSSLMLSGTAIGTVTTNSAGTLALTFNASATNALVNAAMQQIAYASSGVGSPGSVRIDWSFSDNNTGAQGSGGTLTGTGSTVVTVQTASAINVSAAGVSTSESGASASFSVVLASAPTANVTVPVSSSNVREGTVSPALLTFTPANWNVPQNVSVTGVDDALVDGNQNYSVVLGAASSADANYNGLDPRDVSVTNQDNDTVNTLIVDTASDLVSNGDTSSIAALIANKGSDGRISLREAITAANNTANGPGGADVIRFNIPDVLVGGAHTITLTSALPTLTGAVVIDASTEPDVAGNGGRPVVVLDGNSNAISGLTLGTGSNGSTVRGLLIRNFGQYGINIQPGANGNTIAGNLIGSMYVNGTDAGSTTFNAGGMYVASSGNTIGGLTAADRNVIAGNGDVGVTLAVGADNTVFIGNYVGLLADGSTVSQNLLAGVKVLSNNNQFGGTVAGSRNVLSGNQNAGLWLDHANNNLVVGNYIGTDATGTLARPNALDGMIISSGTGNRIGGATAAERNILSGNVRQGMEVSGVLTGTVIQGNYIGANVNGAPLGNGAGGVWVGFTSGLSIGGVAAGQGNLIAYNQVWSNEAGVLVDASATGVAILGNSFISNVALGIDLGLDGVTANDTGDGDAGANGLQNTPVLTSAYSAGGNTTVMGTINSKANTTLRLEFFSAPTADASGHGEAQVFLGATTVTTNATGNASFNTVLTGATVAAGQFVTATATVDLGAGQYGSTSEFSVNVVASSAPAGVTVSAPSVSVAESGSTATFTVVLDTAPSANVTIALSASDSTEATLSTSLLTFTSANWNVPQVVTITGVDDTFVDGSVVSAIVTAATVSADAAYNGVTVADVAVTTSDNDTFNTLVVNTTADTTDGDTSSIAALMANKGADGRISLREAILATNNTANGSGGVDRISFNIPEALVGGAHTIVVTSSLPSITQGVVIDGSTAPDFSGVPVIELSGASAGASATGLVLNTGSDGSTLKALTINRFDGREIVIDGGSGHNVIVGNRLGTDVTGLSVLGAGAWGIDVNSAGASNQIGSSAAADRNIIGGHRLGGIAINGGSSAGTVIQGNYIGVGADGTTPMPNSMYGGVYLLNSPTGTLIGGTGVGEGNLIASNAGGGGVVITGSVALNNTMLGNRIVGNQGLGIDINGDGVTANDLGDGDSGPNGQQNYPVLTSVTGIGLDTFVAGSINTTPNTTLRLEFFGNHGIAADASGHGEAQTILGSTEVTTDATGNATFNLQFAGVTVADGDLITATATVKTGASTYGGTSEFAANVTAVVLLAQTNTAPSFGVGDGVVSTTVSGPGFDSANAVVLQADGCIVVAGSVYNGTNNDMVLLRYLANGEPDGSFGVGGLVITSFGAGDEFATSLALQADGRLVVAGSTSSGAGYDFAVARYNTNGSLDTSFGGTGRVMVDFSGDDFADGVAIQADGKIVVVGVADGSVSGDFALVRLNADGSLDTSFSGDGKVTTPVGAGADQANAVVIQPDGHIVAVGVADLSGNQDMAVVRYMPDGSLDASFDSDGMKLVDLNGAADSAAAVALQGDGRIVMTGTTVVGGVAQAGVVRLDASGALDATFSGDGMTTIPFGNVADHAKAVAVQADGRIVVAGESFLGGTNNMAFGRLNADGTPDATFAGTGRLMVDLSTGTDSATAVALQSDGHIVGAGYSSPANGETAVVRLNADGSMDTRFHLTTTLDGSPTFFEGSAAVVMDSNVQILDAELVLSGHYDGATLSLQRLEGVNADDVFGSTGSLAALIEGGHLVVSGVTIGTVTHNSGGSLVLTFNASATQALVNSTLQSLTYANTSVTPVPNVTVAWTFNDNNTGVQGAGGALSTSGQVFVTITSVNSAPSITSDGGGATATMSVGEGSTAVTHVTSTDPEGDVLSYSIVGGTDAARFTVNAATGVITFVAAPDYEAPSDANLDNFYQVIVQASDGHGGTDTQALTISVSDVNDTPVVALPVGNQSATEDMPFGLQVQAAAFTDQDAGDSLTYSASGLPAWLSFNPVTRLFSGTPTNADVGAVSVTVIATDLLGASVSNTFTLTVSNVNDAPVLSGAVVTLPGTNEDTAPASMSVAAMLASTDWADVDAGALQGIAVTGKVGNNAGGWSYTVDGGTTWFAFGAVGANNALLLPGTALVRYVPDTLNAEVASLTFRAWDQTLGVPTTNGQFSYTDPGAGGGTTAFSSSTATASCTVTAVNDAPSITNSAVVALAVMNEDSVSAAQTVGAMLTAAGWADVDVGAAKGLAVTGQVGHSAWQYSTDGVAWTPFGATSASSALLLSDTTQVRYVGDTMNGEAASLTFRAWDTTLGTASVAGAPSYANPGSGGSPSAWSSQVASATLVVTAVNDAPTLASALADKTATEGAAFTWVLPANSFADVDAGDSLSYTTSTLPAWLSFDAATRTFSGTPANVDVGTVSITVTATDTSGVAVSDTFGLTVTNTNNVPTLANALADQTATEDAPFSFQAPVNTFADVDAGDSLSYTTSALPAWLSFDAATRTFSGTPANPDVGTVSVTLTATDGAGASASATFSLVINNTNDAPTLANAVADQTTAEDAAYSFQIPANSFADVDAGDSLSYTTSTLPAWLSFDAATRTFSGTPANAGVGAVSITVTATDTSGVAVSDTFGLTVTNTNDAPTLANALADQMATEDAPFSFQAPVNTFADVDAGDSLSYTTSALPAWLSFDAATRTFSGTPANPDVGTVSITLTGTDSAGASASATFSLVINNTNDAPTLANAVADQTTAEDAAYSFQIPANSFADLDAGDSLSYTTSALPAWLSFDAATRTFSGTPVNADVGAVSITVTATDNSGVAVSDTFNLVINNTNDAPTLANALADQTATEDAAYSFQIPANTFADVDAGDSLRYTTSTLPAWLSFDAAARTFSGTPANADVGAVSITVTATDNSGVAVSDTFNLVINNTNDAPTLANALADQTATEDAPFSFQAPVNTFADVDAGDSLSYTTSALPAWLSFDAATRTFSGTPANPDMGVVSITMTATDSSGVAVSDTFNLVISNTNDAPTVANAVADQSTAEDAAYSFQIPANSFADVDAGDSLSYTTSALPAWLSFDAATRTFSGTPANADVGTVSITVTATDNSGVAVSDTFGLTVTNTNDAPTLANALADQTATEDAPFSFQAPANTFADVDAGDSLSYTTSALPAWLSFDAATRTFSGTPANPDVGTVSITLTGTDSAGASASATFSLVINNTNDAPTLANAVADQSTAEDAAYSFQIPANSFADVDAGDSLSYTTSALPAWLSFDAATRTFSGTPVNADVGAVSITVMATDISGVAVSDTFGLTVTNTNDAPTLANALADQTATEDAPFSFQAPVNTFADVDAGDSLSYTTSALPAWLSFDAATRTFSGTPANPDVGVVSITMTATDSSGVAVSDTFNLVISNTNDVPTLASPMADQNATEDEAFSFTLSASTFADVDVGDSLSYTTSALPAWLSFDTATRTFSGTPVNEDVGSVAITVTATDASGAQVSGAFTLSVANVNDAPELSSRAALPVAEGQSQAVLVDQFNVRDVDNALATLHYDVIAAPSHGHLELVSAPGQVLAGFSQNELSTGAVRYVHDGSETATDLFQVRVVDPSGAASAVASVQVVVTPVNDEVPVITSFSGATAVAQASPENVVWSADITATDADRPVQNLVFRVAGGADAALFSIDAKTGHLVLNLTPDEEIPVDANADNRYEVVVEVSDGQFQDTQAIVLLIINVNEPPALVNSQVAVTQGSSALLGPQMLSAADPDTPAGQVVFTVSGVNHGYFARTGVPAQAITQFNQADVNEGRVTFVHQDGQVGASFNLTVSDGEWTVGPHVLSVQVNERQASIASVTPVSVDSTAVSTSGSYDGLDKLAKQATGTGLSDAETLRAFIQRASGERRNEEEGLGTDPKPTAESLTREWSGVDNVRVASSQPAQEHRSAPASTTSASADSMRLSSSDLLVMLDNGIDLSGFNQDKTGLLQLTRLAGRNHGDDVRAVQDKIAQEDENPIWQTDNMMRVGNVALSAGLVFWATRASGLLASLVVASPPWRRFDPLPILHTGGKEIPIEIEDEGPESDISGAMAAMAEDILDHRT